MVVIRCGQLVKDFSPYKAHLPVRNMHSWHEYMYNRSGYNTMLTRRGAVGDSYSDHPDRRFAAARDILNAEKVYCNTLDTVSRVFVTPLKRAIQSNRYNYLYIYPYYCPSVRSLYISFSSNKFVSLSIAYCLLQLL